MLMTEQKSKKIDENKISQRRKHRKNREQMEDVLQFIIGMSFLMLVCVLMMFLVLSGEKEWIDSSGTLEPVLTFSSADEEKCSETDSEHEETLSKEAIQESVTKEQEGVENTGVNEESNLGEHESYISEVSIMAVGDNLMHKSVTYSGLQKDGSWDFSNLFANIQSDIQEADVSILCQEVVMGGMELEISGYPSFNTVQEIGHSIVEVGFDVVAFANNHILDKGIKGISNTISFWKENYPDICYVGIHESEEAQNEIAIVEQNGIKIAILNYTYGLNGRSLPSGQEYWVDLLANETQMILDIQKAKDEADFIIMMPHWGTEYSFDVNEQQQRLTQLWADLGVDLVIGSHPHVVQPVQWIEREKYENPMLVYYSLGNFVSIQDKKERMIGAMAKITIQKKDGETFISDHSMDILVTHYESHVGEEYYTNVTTYPMEQYTPELAAKHAIITSYDSSFSYESVIELAQWLMERVE